MHTYLHACLHTCTCAYLAIASRGGPPLKEALLLTGMCICMCMCAYMHVYSMCICVHMCVCMCACVHTHVCYLPAAGRAALEGLDVTRHAASSLLASPGGGMYACVHVCMCACACISCMCACASYACVFWRPPGAVRRHSRGSHDECIRIYVHAPIALSGTCVVCGAGEPDHDLRVELLLDCADQRLTQCMHSHMRMH